MGRSFNTGRFPVGEAPSILALPVKTGQTFKRLALVVLDGDGLLTECGADPASILGVALQGAFTGPGYDAANTPTVITGRSNECSVAIANDATVFSCRGVNGGTDPVTPTATMVNEDYGVVKVGDDWCLDLADAVATRAKIVDIDIDNKVFFVKILEANRQQG